MNRITISGFIASDLDPKTVGSDKVVLNFTLGVKRGEGVDFFNCVGWGDLAQQLAQEGCKGTQVAIAGYLTTQSWTDKTTNQKRDKVVITVTEVIISPQIAHQGRSPNAWL